MKRFFMIIAIIGIFTGCYNDKADKLYVTPATPDSCNVTTVTFAAVIQPIIQKNCAISGCHDASSINGYLLDNYAHIALQARNGNLVGTVTHASGFDPMPQTGSITACQVKQIQAWVAAGYQNN